MNKVTHFFLCAIVIGVCNADNPLARITGGEDVDIKDYPYQVSLRRAMIDPKNPPSHFCGGSIIDKNHILTAAHCLVNEHIQLLEHITVHAGTSRRDEQGSVYQVMTIIAHPEYTTDPLANDIGIIKLKTPIKFSQTQKPIQLPSQDFKDGEVGTVTGWGYTNTIYDRRRTSAIILQKLQVKLFNPKVCPEIKKNANLVDDSFFCGYADPIEVKYENGYVDTVYRDACRGDSGGPLVTNNHIAGVVSHGLIGACGLGSPALYTNVYQFLNFIKKTVGN